MEQNVIQKVEVMHHFVTKLRILKTNWHFYAKKTPFIRKKLAGTIDVKI